MNRCDYLDPALVWTGVKDTGKGAALSAIGYDNLTRPKSYHLRESDLSAERWGGGRMSDARTYGFAAVTARRYRRLADPADARHARDAVRGSLHLWRQFTGLADNFQRF